MIACAEAPQLHLFAIFDLLRITVSPLHWHIGVGVGVDKHIESAVAIQHRQKGYRCCDLPKNGLNLRLNLCLGFFLRCLG